MATTTNSGARPIARRSPRRRHRPVAAARPGLLALTLAAAWSGASAQQGAAAEGIGNAGPRGSAAAPAAAAASAAQTISGVPVGPPPFLSPSISVSLLGTDNALLTATDRRSDVIADGRIEVALHRRGARLSVDGTLGADAIAYANHTAPDRILPRGNLSLSAILAEQALFLDAGVAIARTRADPFAPSLGESSTANTLSTVTYRISPYFAHDFSPTVSAYARSDTSVTRNHSADPGVVAPLGTTIQGETVRIERKPVPFGIALQASRNETTYQGQSQGALVDDNARAIVSAAIDSELLVGVSGGRDHTAYSGLSFDETTYGLVAQWRPSGRLQFDADAEHRFFGTAWNVHFRDRLPLAVLDVSYRRAAEAAPAGIALPTPDADPAALLDSLLSTRVPAQGARDAVVDQIEQTRSLPDDFGQAVSIFSQTPQLVQTARAELLLNGIRNTVLGSLFYAKSETLPGLAANPQALDTRQWGGSIGWYHRLTPAMTAAAELSYVDVQGLDANAADSSHQALGTFSLTRRLGPGAAFSCGVRRLSARVTQSTLGTDVRVDENEVFAGLRMQY